jgi:hypothetical protein
MRGYSKSMLVYIKLRRKKGKQLVREVLRESSISEFDFI